MVYDAKRLGHLRSTAFLGDAEAAEDSPRVIESGGSGQTLTGLSLHDIGNGSLTKKSSQGYLRMQIHERSRALISGQRVVLRVCG